MNGLAKRMKAWLCMLLALSAVDAWGVSPVDAASLATVTVEFVVPAYLQMQADLESAEEGGTEPRVVLVIATNQNQWVLVAGVESRAAASLPASAEGEDVAVQMVVTEYDLRGRPAVAEVLAWRSQEMQRTYTVVGGGGAGPSQRLRVDYLVHPLLRQAPDDVGPLRVVYTVVR